MFKQFEDIFGVSPVKLTEGTARGLITLKYGNKFPINEYLSTSPILLDQLLFIMDEIDPMLIMYLLPAIAYQSFSSDIVKQLLPHNQYKFPEHNGELPPISMYNFMLQVIVEMTNQSTQDIHLIRVKQLLSFMIKENYQEYCYKYYVRMSLNLSNKLAVEWVFNDIEITPGFVRKVVYYQTPSRVRGALERYGIEWYDNVIESNRSTIGSTTLSDPLSVTDKYEDHIKEEEQLMGRDIYPRDATFEEIVYFIRSVLDRKIFESGQQLYQSFQRRRYNHLVGLIGSVLDIVAPGSYVKVDEDL